EHLPYLVEVDNWGASNRGGQATQTPRPDYWVWGYDEMSWFARRSEPYRNDWLRYAWNWLKEHDRNGFLEMPGSRVLHDGPPLMPEGVRKIGWYFANTSSPACPQGFNQEETIKAIWLADSRLAQSLGLGVDATFISAVQQFTAAMAKYRPHKSFDWL
ncbi:MAG: hypothetical protein M1541_11475, partial [Acidobacteria bacterium]|nr:hypothetical protein [Acidobacteriota bacterium]